MSNHKSNMQRQSETAKRTTGPMKIKFRGHTYTVADQELWTIDALELMADMEEKPTKAIALVRELMGEGPWKSFKDRHNNVKAFNEFCEALFAEVEKRSGGEDSPN